MSKSFAIDDPTCVVKMLDEFRSCNPSTQSNLIDRTKTLFPTRLTFDDSVTSTDSKKRKISSVSEENKEQSDLSLPASPWDIRQLKAELLVEKTQNINLENRLKKLYALKKESDLVFDNEKTSLLKEQERDREKIRTLENRVNVLRKRELDTKEELSQIKQSMETNKFNLEKKILWQQKEIAQLEDKMKQVEQSLHKRSTNGDRKISELESQLKLSIEEVTGLKDFIKLLESKQAEMTNQKLQLELSEQYLSEARQKIKELELEQEKEKETRELLEKQHHNLVRVPELEREVTTLQEENQNLRDTINNKLLLEEEVMDLRKRQEGIDELEKQVSHLQATKLIQESALEQWHNLARDHCIGVAPEKAGPELLRMRIENLQQKELLLTAEKGSLDSCLKALRQSKATVEAELEKATKELEKLQIKQDQQSSLIKRLQKKLLLVSRERDSYRSQLDMYEKDLTITSTSAAALSNAQQQKSRIDALEKAVEGYRELVERLESEIDNTKGSDSVQLSDQLQKLREEKDALQKENETLKKRRDELEIEMEYRALKGDFNPMKSKVLHFRMNPVAEAEAERVNEITKLQKECEQLRERLRIMEEGQTEDITQAVNVRLAASSSQEVQELREQVKSYDTKIQRLKEAFKATSQEFRELCYMLFGYKINRIKPNLYRLSSMFAESPEDHLMFKVGSDGADLLETPYSATLEEYIDLHLKHQHSIPVFLSTITVDLFSHQTLSSTEEPVVID